MLVTFLCLRRGVSLSPYGKELWMLLFSAYAEVFLPRLHHRDQLHPFLCLRRGVSGLEIGAKVDIIFSLPTQRCFRSSPSSTTSGALFSAYAEVFLSPKAPKPWKATFLCLRRGVSARITARSSRISFSLPTQRCFPVVSHSPALFLLFSAYAEVFLQP